MSSIFSSFKSPTFRFIRSSAASGWFDVHRINKWEDFFKRLGFAVVPKETLPHKVWTDCVRCPLQENCDEIAMVYELS